MMEDQARTKWCPYARTDLGCNWSNTRCIASDCMAWRWYKDNRDEIGMCEMDAPERGYCGLSGKP